MHAYIYPIERERECVYILKYLIISSNNECNNLNIKSGDFYLFWNYFFIPRFFLEILDFRLFLLDKIFFVKFCIISGFANNSDR